MSAVKELLLILLSGLVVHTQSCSSGWINFQEHCYLFAYTLHTWADAQSICTALHGKLAEPRSKAELDFITTEVNNRNGHGVSQFWIGINDIAIENRWEYSSDDSILTVTAWGPHEPDGRESENCVAAATSISGKWADLACGRHVHYICEKTNKANGDNEIIG